jgi:hypothetical protein
MIVAVAALSTTPHQFFKGTLDEVVVYPRALSGDELGDYVQHHAGAVIARVRLVGQNV